MRSGIATTRSVRYYLSVMGKRKRDKCFNPLLGEVCEACGDWFQTIQGVMTHQSNSKKCAWYKKGKLKAIYEPLSDEDEEFEVAKDSQVDAAFLDDMDVSGAGASTRYVCAHAVHILLMV